MEFEPMFVALEGALNGKRIALFAAPVAGVTAIGCGGWRGRRGSAGGSLLDENGLMVNETPNAEGGEACKELGRRKL